MLVTGTAKLSHLNKDSGSLCERRSAAADVCRWVRGSKHAVQATPSRRCWRMESDSSGNSELRVCRCLACDRRGDLLLIIVENLLCFVSLRLYGHLLIRLFFLPPRGKVDRSVFSHSALFLAFFPFRRIDLSIVHLFYFIFSMFQTKYCRAYAQYHDQSQTSSPHVDGMIRGVHRCRASRLPLMANSNVVYVAFPKSLAA